MLEIQEYGDPDGHPAFFFHGLIGSHHQASYIAEQARANGLRIIAPNRPGVGDSEFVRRTSPLEAVADVEDLSAALGVGRFSVIGISGGTPYALSCLLRMGGRLDTVTIISGMGPTTLRGALRGMDRRRRLALELGSRYPNLAHKEIQRWCDRFNARPRAFLDRLVATWPEPDRTLFRREDIYDLFLLDLRQVFTVGRGAETFSQDLFLYRNYSFSLRDLPARPQVTLWQGLDDTIVPPSMAWEMTRALPNCEAHFVPGGHFMAITVSDRIVKRLMEQLEDTGAVSASGRRDQE